MHAGLGVSFGDVEAGAARMDNIQELLLPHLRFVLSARPGEGKKIRSLMLALMATIHGSREEPSTTTLIYRLNGTTGCRRPTRSDATASRYWPLFADQGRPPDRIFCCPGAQERAVSLTSFFEKLEV